MCRAPKAPTVFSTSATMSGNPAAGDDHNRAFFGKRQGSGFADAGGASGDEDSLVLEGFHSWPQRSECRFFGKVNGESCRRHGIEPYTCLHDLLTRLPRKSVTQLFLAQPTTGAFFETRATNSSTLESKSFRMGDLFVFL